MTTPSDAQKSSNTTEATQQAEGKASSTSPPTNAAPPRSPKPPKGPRLWVMLLVIVGLGFGFVGGSIWGTAARNRIDTILRDRAANAEPQIESTADHADHEHEQGNGLYAFFTCGMHPWVILPEDGICPICHMDLEPIDPDKFSGSITIDPVVTQNIGVRVAPVITGPLERTIRTVGSLDYDETRVRDINIKVPGWIEKLFVDSLGTQVNAGEPLFTYYSPELYAAQDEYLLALRSQKDTGTTSLPGMSQNTTNLVASSRTRLEYYDITNEQIQDLEKSGIPSKNMEMRSPYSGIVIAKHANEGMHVDLGMRVYRIADLSKIWVMVSLYEYQLPFIEEGQKAIMTLPYIPGKTFTGHIVYIYPYLDPSTRQINVRLEFDNPTGLLKPGMFASIELKSTLSDDRTLAPRTAIIDTGERSVAFVSLGEGRFEPREVQMGVETDNDMVEILDGLKPGEMVVTSGQFLLDSEARVRDSLAKMIRGDMAVDQEAVVKTAPRPQANQDSGKLPAHAQGMLADILDAYFVIQDALAQDTTDSIADPANTIAKKADMLHDMQMPGMEAFSQAFGNDLENISQLAQQISTGSDLKEARQHFYDISIALTKIVQSTGIPPTVRVDVQQLHCPMYKSGQGGSVWLQPAGEVKNPFLGSRMLECFDERIALPVAGKDSP